MARPPERPSSCSCQPSASSSRDCFAFVPLPPCPRFARGEHLTLAGKPLEGCQNGGDQLLSARVLRRERSRKETEEIAGFFGSFMPIRCRRRQQVRF